MSLIKPIERPQWPLWRTGMIVIEKEILDSGLYTHASKYMYVFNKFLLQYVCRVTSNLESFMS